MKATTILSIIGLAMLLAVSGCKKKESTEVVPEPPVDSSRIDGRFSFIRQTSLASGWYLNESESATVSLFHSPQSWDQSVQYAGVDAGAVTVNGWELNQSSGSVYSISKDSYNALGLDSARAVAVSGSSSFPHILVNFGPFPSFIRPDTIRKNEGLTIRFNEGIDRTDTVLLGIDTLNWSLVPDANREIRVPSAGLSTLANTIYTLRLDYITSKSLRAGGKHFRIDNATFYSNTVVIVD